MVTDSTRDRAQVILIGAIVIAFVILGVVVVLNGLVHTEEMSSSSTSQSTSQSEMKEYEIKQGIRGIAKSDIENAGGWEKIINEDEDFDQILRNEDDWEEIIVKKNILYEKTSANSHSSVTKVDENSIGGDSSIEAVFEERSGGDDILDSPGRIFHFELETYNQGMQQEDSEIILEKEDGTATTIAVESRNPPSHTIFVNATGDHIEGDGETCEAERINLVTGEVENGEPDCGDMDVINSSIEYETFEFINPTGGQIEYDVIAHGDVKYNDKEVPGTLNLTYTYDSTDTDIERQIIVELYSETL